MLLPCLGEFAAYYKGLWVSLSVIEDVIRREQAHLCTVADADPFRESICAKKEKLLSRALFRPKMKFRCMDVIMLDG